MKKVFVIGVLIWSGATAQTIRKVAPGVWSISFGTPETFTPTAFKAAPALSALKSLGDPANPPVSGIQFKTTSRGCVLEIPMDDKEKIYGFGLQVNTFQQRGLRREMHANSNIVGNVGFSHAPVPFYVSTDGYGVLINSSRYVTFYSGTMQRAADLKDNKARELGFTTQDLYSPHNRYSDRMIVEIPAEKGVEVLLFAGPDMDHAVRRYNLYAGGGCLPPVWGLGMKYRGKGDFTDERAVHLASYFRDNQVPCTTYGLEPGWQSRAYSCSFVWNPERFKDPTKFIGRMDSLHYHLNLWEHAYTNPVSPLFKPLTNKSGDYMVWGGLVPDFADAQAREVFGAYHDTAFIQKGIAAFKLDECDAADYKDAAAQWSFPEMSQFPSGIDGEKMHELFGILYQKAILKEYRLHDKRTLLDVRSSGAFASPYPSLLYSDMYNNADYVRMILNSGFSGLLWSPEIRDTKSEADLIRRTQTGVLSAQMCFNSWYLSNPPWFQIDRKKNDQGDFLPDLKELEARIRALSELRMRLVPYLYTAFADYHFNGEPPFRALVMDYPADDTARTVDDEYLIGPALLAAPFLDGSSHRKVYFPAGTWYDFNTGQKYTGGQSYAIDMTLDQVPLFVKDGSILPLADPVPYITAQTVFKITCRVYGAAPAATTLYEDDGQGFGYEQGQYNHVALKWDGSAGNTARSGNYAGHLYEIAHWEKVP